MGYSEQPVGLSQRQFATVGGILVIVILAASLLFHVANRPNHAARADVEVAAQRNLRISASALTLKQLYPVAYAKILSENLGKIEATRLDTQLVGGFQNGLSTFLRSRKEAILRAPDAQLAAIATARSIMISRLAVTSLGACASYAQFAMSPGWEVEDISRSLAADVDAALIRAAKAGEGQGARPRADTLDAATLAALDAAAIRRGMTAAQRMIQHNENRVGLRESDRTRCIAGMLYFRSVADLPAALAARVIADDLQHSPLLGPAPTK